MRKALILMAASLTGCSNFDGVRQSLGSPPMVRTEQPDRLREHGENLDDLQAFLRRYDLIVRTGSKLPPIVVTVLPPEGAGAGSRQTSAPERYRFGADFHGKPYAVEQAQYTTLLSSYVSGRRDQVDGLCATFFDGLQTLASGTQWGQDTFNIFANTASVIGGLTEASSKQLAILSGLQIAVDDTFNATKSALLLSPAPNSVYQLVRAEQASRLAQSSAPANFEEAERLVRTYTLPCTQNGIKDLIEDSLKQGAQKRAAEGLDTAKASVLLNPLLPLLNEGSDEELTAIDGTQGAALYWIFVLAPTAGAQERIENEQKAGLALLGPQLAKHVESVLGNPERTQRMTTALKSLALTNGWVGTEARGLQDKYAGKAAIEAAANAKVVAAKNEAEAAKRALEQAQAAANSAQQAASTAERAAQDQVRTLQNELAALRKENEELKAASAQPQPQ